VLVTGISGAEFGIRGFIDGWDPETGKQLWRRYTIPARGEKATRPGHRTTMLGKLAAAPPGSRAPTTPS
jgi:alcohol dehydrogenase (cytochrome c)